ncbi:MAG: hypothetical protein HRU32_17100 [Rhodobacteraceae bacterium]|nr:hypothetical protein [Paracoccaceae bacterium]
MHTYAKTRFSNRCNLGEGGWLSSLNADFVAATGDNKPAAKKRQQQTLRQHKCAAADHWGKMKNSLVVGASLLALSIAAPIGSAALAQGS